MKFRENYTTIQTDILVIGAGGAGIRAAIEAKKRNAKVILLGKEVLGCAHTGMAMGGMNAAIVSPATPDFHAQITLQGGYGINNKKLVRVFTEEIPQRIYDLEKYGVIFDRRDNGEFYVWSGPKQKYPLNVCVGDYTGREMMQGLVDEARRLKVQYSDEFFISKLLTRNQRVIGAIGINIKTGKYFVFGAKAVILATGGAGRMYEVTTNAASNTGDGYALALSVGAELIDMEMVQFHPTGMAHPPSVRGVLVTEKVRSHGGILKNKDGERFMARYNPKEMEMATRDEVARAIYKEVASGKGTRHRAVFLYVNHWKIAEIRDKIPDVFEQYKNVGIDISKLPMEVYPSMHHMMGGVRINQWGESSIEGLYAVGEVTGGIHGANRLGGNSLSEGQVFGRRSALSAYQYQRKFKNDSLSKKQIRQEIDRIERFKLRRKGITPYQIEKTLKKVMWENVGIFRDEKILLKAIKKIEKLIKESKHLKTRTKEKTRNRDLQDCLEVVNMLKTAQAVVEAALLRQESRGAHSRIDYPQTSDQWLKNIVVKARGNKVSTKIIPIT